MTPRPTRLVLTRPHTHAGRTFQAGECIDVDPSAAQWLLEQGIAAPPESDPPVDEPRLEPSKSSSKSTSKEIKP